jgi:hypothetical protein
MEAILEISSYKFLFPNAETAAKVLTSLSKAISVDCEWDREVSGRIYTESDHSPSLQIEMVGNRDKIQLRAAAPRMGNQPKVKPMRSASPKQLKAHVLKLTDGSGY